MKKIILLFALIAASNINFAQNYDLEHIPWRFWNEFNLHSESKQRKSERELLKQNQVKSREKISYDKGVPFSTMEYFDEEGRVVRIERHWKKGGKSVSTLTYTAFGELKEVKGSDSKNRSWKTVYTYDEENRLVTTLSLSVKNVYKKTEVAYNEHGKLSYRKIYEKDTVNPKRELVYAYYDNGDKKETNYYEKGKLKHTWKFECKPEGELINVKEKDATKFCLLEDLDENGNRVVWERKFDEKGRLTKVRTVYSPDSLIIMKQRYVGTDRLVYERVNTFDEANNYAGSTVTTYDKKGEAFLSSKSTYSKEKGSRTVYYDKKGEISYTSFYLMNENGKPLKIQGIGKGWNNTKLYHYNDQDLLSSEIRIYKGRTYINEYNYEFY